MTTAALLLAIVSAQAPPDAGAPEGGVSDRANQRVQAVVDTLGDLLKSIDNEEETEEKNHACYEQWCEKEIAQKATEIDDDGLRIEDLKVSINEYDAAISRNTFALEGDKKDVAEIQDALAQATSIREEEKEKYERDRAMNQQSVSQLGDAISIVKRAQVTGFMQTKQTQGLQISAPGESSFVLGVFESLEKNLKRNQQKADDIESKKAGMYDQLHGGKTSQLQIVQGDIRTKDALVAEANQKKVDAQNDLTSTTEALEAGRAGHEDLTEDCENRNKEWSERQVDRQQEKAAIREAMSFLTISFGKGADAAAAAPVSFLQVKSMAGVSASLSSLNEELLGMEQSAREGQSKDHFSSVKKVVTNLIQVLQKEEQDEEEKKRWCEAEMESNERSNTTKTEQQARLTAAIGKGTALIEELSLAAESINASITEMNEAQTKAGELRKDEKAQFERATKDRNLATKVLDEAASVLRTFYASQAPALVQAKGEAGDAQTPQPQGQASQRHAGESNVVLAMLGKIRDDINHEQSKAADAESKAEKAFEKYTLDCRADFDSMMAEITEKVTRRAKLEVKLESSTEDSDAGTESLLALATKITATNSECEPIVEHWDERSKARLFQIDQLKDAFEILSGSQIAARTAFLTAERNFVAQKTSDSVLRELQDTAKTVSSLVEEA